MPRFKIKIGIEKSDLILSFDYWNLDIFFMHIYIYWICK